MRVVCKTEKIHNGKKAVEIEFTLPLPCESACPEGKTYKIIIYEEGATRYFLAKDQEKYIDAYYAGDSGFKGSSDSTFAKKAFCKDMLIRTLIEEVGDY